MAKTVLTNASLWHGGFEVAYLIRSIVVDGVADSVECTTFGSAGNREYVGGMKDFTWTGESYFDDTLDWDFELALFNQTVTPTVLTLSSSPAEGDLAYLSRTFSSTNSRGGTIGALAQCNFTLRNDKPTVRGVILDIQTAFAATASSTGIQQGAVAAGQRARSIISATATSGSPTLDVVIESDDNSGFSSATTRLTHTQITAAEVSEYLETNGAAITDDYWRTTATFGGTGSIDFMVAFGIG